MKKVNAPKISLNRETLRRIDDTKLPAIAGGSLAACSNATACTACDTYGCYTTHCHSCF
jgi:hypothetical protein